MFEVLHSHLRPELTGDFEVKIKLTHLATLAVMLPSIAMADVDCEKVVIAGQTQATGPTTFAGDGQSNVGQMQVFVEITSTKPNTDGSLNATTIHQLVLPQWSVSTSDRARLVPLNDAGMYRLDTQAVISEGGWGHLKIDGLVNFATGEARWIAEGRICTAPTS